MASKEATGAAGLEPATPGFGGLCLAAYQAPAALPILSGRLALAEVFLAIGRKRQQGRRVRFASQ
jgi:hypothetical protein